MPPGRVELTLLGQALTVRTEADPEYVRTLARYLEERVAALAKSGVKEPMAALTLAALDITDELFRLRDERKDQEVDHKDVSARLGALRQILDAVVPEK